MVDSRSNNQDRVTEKALQKFVDAYLRGEQPDTEEFVKQHPDCEDLLRKRIQNLLKINTLLDTLVQMDESDFAATATDLDSVGGKVESFEKGEMIGRYKLLRILGEGGFGIVYLAEQQRPMKRQVALKIIKPGMDSAQVIRRFEAERQALALLDHPNVAHVYDAGTTKFGRPYFVMEYVKGVPITEHCDRHKLTIEERLELFVKVCEAIQHAHQKGIIHRDIKPSNIQVCIQGEQFVPKVIDFGIAKALTQQLTERTLVTEQGQLIGTPEYISPEQAEMTNQDIDTRADIYSLGILLYELLTGTLPFESETLRKGNLEQMRKVICEAEPRTPSTRVSDLDAEASTRLATCCQIDSGTLRRKLRGDLDWITLKAMEKERVRRYQSAHGLAEDIQRHLNSEPVLARPPSSMYRLQKFIQKHRTQAIRTAVAGILLVLIAVISVMYVKAAERNKEADALEDRDILSKATECSSKGQLEQARAEVEKVVDSEHVGPEARLLLAQIILRVQGPAAAINPLEELTNERDEIACQAHYLLARIYIETDPNDSNEIQAYKEKGEYHQQEGTRLLPESPEAYFNRSMMAGTVKETLEMLNRALDLDRDHYDSLEARTLIYYALKEYVLMSTDASQMVGNSSNNSRGYALRAIAQREIAIQQGEDELLSRAITDHNEAIRLSPDDADLYDQRRRTYVQMGDHRQALSDAQECVRLEPDQKINHFHVFCAMIALGHFEEAKEEYYRVFDSHWRIRSQFRGWAGKHVFDRLNAGKLWHPPGNRPSGVVFLPMVEADETYRRLTEKGAKRIVSDGFAPSWSDDGTKLVYSRGVLGHGGIEIVNLETGKTDLLTVSGFDPSWSPDGRYIVFSRGRKAVLLADLLATDRARYNPRHEHREVWFMKADGTDEPRFLAEGTQPHWRSQDSKQVFYWRPDERKIYAISLKEDSKPIPIAWCPTMFGVISPDGNCVAWTTYSTGHLLVEDIHPRSLIASWAGPVNTNFVNWSSDGSKLTVGSGTGSHEGLWVFDIKMGKASRVLSGGIGGARWSPDATRLAVTLGGPSEEIWVADISSLGPGQTLEEHYQEKVEKFTRWLGADPERTQYYLRRAANNIRLGKRNEVLEDLETYADFVKATDGPNNSSVIAQGYGGAAWSLLHSHNATVDPDFAVELLAKAHQLQPQNWTHLYGLGTAYYRMGQWNDAITELMKSTEENGGANALNYLFLAMAHWQLGNKIEATNWYTRATDSMEGRDDSWFRSNYYIYSEASELMGIEIREF
ncbi:MAG: protein kinase domain-containing protein [Planctomycetota bacterium]|jgi:serine/threonine protein kinase/Tol biopolymer transport system component